MDEIIKTVNLSKHFGKVCAVDDISLSVKKGEIFGFLGLNGTGKTTTIRMLLGMIRPTSGTSFLCGRQIHPGNHEIFRNVGYLVEIPYSYPDLTVWENLEITRRLRLMSDRAAVDEVIDRLHLRPYAQRKAGTLSRGNAQRLGLAKALIHDPEILILDEPANGLDPSGIVEIRELLHDLALKHGVTVFISSHLLGEISRFATRIGIIHEGHLIQEMDTDRLDQLCHKRLMLDAHDREAARATLAENGYSVSVSGEGILESRDEEAIRHPEDIATLLVHAGLPPTLLRVEEEDLESYFLRAIGKNGGIR